MDYGYITNTKYDNELSHEFDEAYNKNRKPLPEGWEEIEGLKGRDFLNLLYANLECEIPPVRANKFGFMSIPMSSEFLEDAYDTVIDYARYFGEQAARIVDDGIEKMPEWLKKYKKIIFLKKPVLDVYYNYNYDAYNLRVIFVMFTNKHDEKIYEGTRIPWLKYRDFDNPCEVLS